MPIETKQTRAILLDTHIWLRFAALTAPISQPAIRAIEASRRHRSVYVSVISVWELAMLITAKKFELDEPIKGWVAEAFNSPEIHLLPLTPEIAIDAACLPAPMHKDSADRIIVASAMAERLTLVTADRLVLSFARHIGMQCIEG